MNKALFLDRDGIINIDHGYVYQQETFEFVDGIFELCADAIAKGYLLIVITNQSGIGRGRYSEQDFLALTHWMKKQFRAKNCVITDVYFCPHHPTKGKGEYLQACQCRKPEPGMILKASNEHKIDLKQSIFIGDKISDMQAAQAAGIHNRILVASKYDDHQQIKAHRVSELADARAFID
ncbi:D,D-heptose 1,7-bisphosphate phosphatase [Thalassotalea insulae]|uniref:D,D-heptose 1,7-bisphosphate phosphatase n=1 Tax=Thalassotalea insulae TaxID=2056778 RepID=A0ABQ6GX37_9GAMM|nr:D-glycero-beta-D-manno-heptose 1,7-bisphosphate 7-phosphatase [Thalassotalea insulae]GLX79879.1 D,D-heptose 1,7-bisphosphate phosphatase [Thalassotalea insulae]